MSDLVLGQRKIGGACIYRSGALVHYSTTLLVEPQVELMERYLLHPPREPEYRQGRSHAEFVTNLPAPRGVEALRRDLQEVLRPPALSVKLRGSRGRGAKERRGGDGVGVASSASESGAVCPTSPPEAWAPIRRFPAAPVPPTGAGPVQRA